MKSQSHKFRWLMCAVGVLAPTFLGTVGVAYADEVFSPTTAITLSGGQIINSFDISFVDPVIGRYLLADRTNKSVDVVDTRTNTVVTQLKAGFVGFTGNNDTSGPDGVIVVDHRDAWVGDGDSTIKVINISTGALVTTIPTGGKNRADELCVDPRRGVVLMANDAETEVVGGVTIPAPFITFWGTNDFASQGKITFDGQPGAGHSVAATNGIEQCQWNHRNGKFYINIPEVAGPGDDSVPGAVVVIDPVSKNIEHIFTIPVANCAGPQGMAFGPGHEVLLGCNAPGPSGNNPTVIIDDRDGHIIQTLNNESGADEVWFNKGDDHYFLARSSAVGAQFLGVVDAKSASEDTSVQINAVGKGNAHSVAADPIRNQVYVPIPNTATAKVCSSAGGIDTQGCIAVFTTPNDDRCVAEGSPVIRVTDQGDEDNMTEGCHSN